MQQILVESLVVVRVIVAKVMLMVSISTVFFVVNIFPIILDQTKHAEVLLSGSATTI
jgi:hypothetical protein